VKGGLTFLGVFPMLLLRPAVAADLINFTGHTTAGTTVIAKIDTMLGVLAPIYLNCPQVDSVLAGDVPDDLLPRAEQMQIPNTLSPLPKGPVRYELWTIGGCEHTAEVFIKLWYLDTGEETFMMSPVIAPSWNGS
jgi:hypothetical protein